MDEKPQKELSKTLTFGLGMVSGFIPGKKPKLVELTEEQRRFVYEHLRRASAAVAQACNIEACKEYARLTLNLAKDKFPEIKASNPAIRDRIEDAQWIAGGTLSQAYMQTKPHFTGEHGKELMLAGKRNLPTHRTDGTYPIPFRATETRLLRLNGQFWLCVPLFEAKYAKSHVVPNWLAFPVVAKKRDRTLNAQLDRVVSGEWKARNSRIRRDPKGRKRKWIGQMVVSYIPSPYKTLTPDTIMGIDRGVVAPAAVHIRVNGVAQKWAILVGRGQDLLNSRNVVRGEIKRIVRGLRSKDSGLVGKAREAARERLRELRRREKRIIKTGSQRVAAQIAELARRNGAGVWQVEKFSSSIKDDSWLARNWAPGTLLDAIRWNAEKFGATLVEVEPQFTSQRCSECGHIDSRNRQDQKTFLCVECGHKENADKNAARNLSTPGIDLLISNWKKANLNQASNEADH